MTLRMYDSVTPADLPAGADAYAGYVNGRYANVAAIRERFPRAHLLSIAVTVGADADCLDVEPGDATIPEAPAWVRRQQSRGVSRPVVYISASQAAALEHALSGAGIPRGSYRLWTAHYDAGKHFCGPRTCGFGVSQADGTQWFNSDAKGYDESVLADNFFGAVPPPRPAPGTSPTEAIVNALPTLRMGSTGTPVRRAQALLNVAGQRLTEDGDFGPATDAAVRTVQRAHGLAVDGVIGTGQTWPLLVTGAP